MGEYEGKIDVKKIENGKSKFHLFKDFEYIDAKEEGHKVDIDEILIMIIG